MKHRLLSLRSVWKISNPNLFSNQTIFVEWVFHEEGTLKKHDVHILGSDILHETGEVSQDTENAIVWSALSFNGVNGPFFIDRPTVNGVSFWH